MVTNVKAIEDTSSITIEGMRAESDHLPLEVEIEEIEEIGRKKRTKRDWLEVKQKRLVRKRN